MAKKKKTTEPASTFDAGSFRMGEQASMAGFEASQTPGATAASIAAAEEAERQNMRNRIAAAEAAANTVIMPTEKELAGMSAAQKRDLRAKIAAQTTKLASSVDLALDKAEKDLNQVLADIAADKKAALAAQAEAAQAVADANAAMAAGDKVITDAVERGDFNYMTLPPVFQGVVNAQPQYSTLSNAGLQAAVSALGALGVEGLVDVMAEIRKLYPTITSEDALSLLKFDKRFNQPYLTRFAGNKMLMDAGFAPLDDKDYLNTERAFDKIFTSYGLGQFNNRDRYSKLIGGRISADELTARVSLAYDRVIKGAKETRDALKSLYPELTDSDLVGYAIDPVNQLPALQRKVQAAEIGGAALVQGLAIGLDAAPTQKTGFTNVQRQGMGISELQAQGVDLESARTGFSRVAERLPTAEKLSALYGARLEQYGRKEAEQEEFAKLASARRAREALAAEEIAQFSGESGFGRIRKPRGGAI